MGNGPPLHWQWGFLSGCYEALGFCEAQFPSKTSETSEPSRLRDSGECAIYAERLILILFSSQQMPVQDGCGALSWATTSLGASYNDTTVRTATLESIVFRPKERVYGMNHEKLGEWRLEDMISPGGCTVYVVSSNTDVLFSQYPARDHAQHEEMDIYIAICIPVI